VTLRIPENALVVLVGPAGSGKTTFAARHFRPTEVVSSDRCRAMVSDDEGDQSATPAAFALLNHIVRKRLERMRLTVIDATNVEREARRSLRRVARDHDVQAVAVVFDLPLALCLERNRARADRTVLDEVVREQAEHLRRSLPTLEREGFHRVWVLRAPAEVETVRLERQRLAVDRREERGPFDVVGDVHGCFDELAALLARLGWEVGEEEGRFRVRHPQGRRLVFLGDLVDRGPAVPRVLNLVMDAVEAGSALCVAGNHDVKLLRALRGRNVRVSHGLAESLAQLGRETPPARARVAAFLEGLPSHYVLDEGRLVVAHAGLKEEYHGRVSERVREFALYGETTGETDAYGLPVRCDWAASYGGEATVVYGHTPVLDPAWQNRTINIDTGCVFGGRLTALRYPEGELVDVEAARVYYQPVKPLGPPRAGP
jgi:polynucleotide kinase-phosphatase